MAGTKKTAKIDNGSMKTKAEKRDFYLKQIAELEKRTQTPAVKEKIRLLQQGLSILER